MSFSLTTVRLLQEIIVECEEQPTEFSRPSEQFRVRALSPVILLSRANVHTSVSKRVRDGAGNMNI
jgi:hypothetical protein